MRPISYSQANLYERCPARYKAERIDGIQAPKSHPLLVGLFMHKVLEMYLDHLIAGGLKSDYAALERFFEEAWKGEQGQVFIESDYVELRELMMNTREGVLLENPAHVVGAELAIAVDIHWNKVEWDDPAAFLRMRLDRLDVDDNGKAIVWDYKTGYKVEAPEESRQLKLYSATVAQLIPRVTSSSGELYYARKEIWRKADYKPDDLEEAKRWILGVYHRISQSLETAHWPATPGAGCGDCPVFEGCEARKTTTTALPPRSREEAEAILGRYAMNDRERKEMQEQLKLWIAQNGPVETAGIMVELAPTIKKEYPIGLLEVTLKTMGFELRHFIKADTDEIKKKSKKDPQFARQVEAIATEKSTTTFTLRRL